MFVILTVIIYFFALLLLSKFTSSSSDNRSFFSANNRSPWHVVAFGMIGSSISGITFVSVPGMVLHSDMTYLQMCLGFIAGYIAVAFVLLPIYYKFRLTSIYTYIRLRMGRRSHLTASWFFLLSKLTGAALRFYLPCYILQQFVFGPAGIPFAVTALGMISLIWLYTRRGGIKTLVWTDAFHTLCMMASLALIILHTAGALDMDCQQAAAAIAASSHSRIFVFDDWLSTQHFLKQFISGIFIVVVMTGLDLHMMQKNLTCKTLRDAQKDMCSYGLAFLPLNLLFLSLGVLLVMYASQQGVPLPHDSDALLPMFAASGNMGGLIAVMFTIGIIAASFGSADSSLTAITTSFCLDIKNNDASPSLRHKTHIAVCALFVLLILLTDQFRTPSLLDTVYTLCSYTYGPLLGMFAFSIFTSRMPNDSLVPIIAVASPLLCFAIDRIALHLAGYDFGYELLLLNGLMVFLAILVSSHSSNEDSLAA